MTLLLDDILGTHAWQMSRAERTAIRGMLATVRPALSIELGAAAGYGTLELARHSAEVHSFDLTAPELAMPANVVLHTGDSHALLPAFLAELTERGTAVDLVVVDGDHSPEGVRRDLEDLLDSPAVANTVILIHDTANERVRAGIDSVRFGAWPKVAHVELDWIPGHIFAEPALRNELWFGLGLVVVDEARRTAAGSSVYEPRFHPAAPLLAEMRMVIADREADPPQIVDALAEADRLRMRAARLQQRAPGNELPHHELPAALGRERAENDALRRALTEHQAALAAVSAEAQRLERTLRQVTDSKSWRLTRPLRGAARRQRSA